MIGRIKELVLLSESTRDEDDAARRWDIPPGLWLSAVWVIGIQCIYLFFLTYLEMSVLDI